MTAGRSSGWSLHRRRSVLVRMTEDGRKLETVRITSSPAALRREIAKAGKHPRVVLEATYGWYWVVDVLEAAGRTCTWRIRWAWVSGRRVKNDYRDAGSGGPLRMGNLPEAWIAPPEIRELRELTRYRHLCRYRHSIRYAEARIMPMPGSDGQGNGVTGTETSA